jgi:fucose 4-O-acetylase-like acetyltransferase
MGIKQIFFIEKKNQNGRLKKTEIFKTATCRFHMPFFIFIAGIISSQQIEKFWWLETYEIFVAFN